MTMNSIVFWEAHANKTHKQEKMTYKTVIATKRMQ
jgi:hypothetical protein